MQNIAQTYAIMCQKFSCSQIIVVIFYVELKKSSDKTYENNENEQT